MSPLPDDWGIRSFHTDKGVLGSALGWPEREKGELTWCINREIWRFVDSHSSRPICQSQALPRSPAIRTPTNDSNSALEHGNFVYYPSVSLLHHFHDSPWATHQLIRHHHIWPSTTRTSIDVKHQYRKHQHPPLFPIPIFGRRR